MKAAFGLFFDRFKVQIVVILLCIMAAMVAYHWTVIALLENDLKNAKERNGELLVENSTLRTANAKASEDIQTQNNAIVKWRIEAAEQSKRAEEAIARLAKQESKWKVRYEDIFIKVPTSTDDCKNTTELLDTYQAARIEEAKGNQP